MRRNRIQMTVNTLGLIGFLGVSIFCHAASQEKTLYSFPKCTGSTNCASAGVSIPHSLIFDKAGNLYGVSVFGGASGSNCQGYGCGYVFMLTPGTNGTWNETTLYNFCSLKNCADGAIPSSGLAFDSDGDLYGTTWYGGATTSGCGGDLCGTVFKLTPGTNGKWTEQVLHSFTGGADGAEPAITTPLLDAKGNIYGTTGLGGAYGYGTVFELTSGASGSWTETVLHSFDFNGTDGIIPSGLAFDAAGNLYGTTNSGGKYSGSACENTGVQNSHCGTVYQLSKSAKGTWKEKILHSFQDNGKDALQPLFGVVIDADGNLYGTTEFGGKNGGGAVFRLAPGKWTETILLNFDQLAPNNAGSFPLSGLVLTAAGDIYGTTKAGGLSGCDGDFGCGTIFELSSVGSQWTETLTYEFSSSSDGVSPGSALTLDPEGNLYGTTNVGGANGDGVVFEIIP